MVAAGCGRNGDRNVVAKQKINCRNTETKHEGESE